MVKLPLKFQAESIQAIGDHGKRREHRDIALLRDLLLTIFTNYAIFGPMGGRVNDSNWSRS